MKQFSYLPSLFLLFLYLGTTSCASLLHREKSRFQDKGGVNITSEPPGADVLLNDKMIGKTPMRLEFKDKPASLKKIQDYSITIRKEGYLDQKTDLFSQNWERKTIGTGGKIFLIGLGEFVGGIGIAVIGASAKDPNTNQTSAGGNVIAWTGVAIMASGALDMKNAFLARPDTLLMRTYNEKINAQLETPEQHAKKIEAERIKAEQDRIALEKERIATAERLEKERIATEERLRKERIAWEADAPARAERERQAEIARQEAARKYAAEQERLRIKELEYRRIKYATWNEGEMICAKEADCRKLNDDDCLNLVAYVEKWNAGRTKCQIRIGGSSSYTLNGRPCKVVDKVYYYIGDVIWVDFDERPNTVWLTCKNK